MSAVCLHAQVTQPATPKSVGATRAELTRMLDSAQRVTGGKANVQKERAADIAGLRSRLADGDLRIGDRFVMLNLAAQQGQSPADSVIVRDSLLISLGAWPAVSVHGLLFSELQPFMERYVGTFVREPRIKILPLARISVVGGVGRQGFFTVDPDRPLSDLMSSVGLAQSSKVDKITIYRGNDRILNEKAVAAALRDGLTFEQTGLESGDQIRVAEQKSSSGRRPNIQVILIALTAFSAVLALIRSSYVD